MLKPVPVLVLKRWYNELLLFEVGRLEADEGLGGGVSPLRDEEDEGQRLLSLTQQALE